jgi:hypothetical protein
VSTSSCGEEADSPQATAEKTAIMMRGIPSCFTRDALVEFLDAQGFIGCYNFVYLPIDLLTGMPCGYAFINLSTPFEADKFRSHFEGFVGWPMCSEKVCRASWSHIGGLQAHVERYRSSPVQHKSVPDKFKPLLFSGGERIPFPPPAKKISPPRFKTAVLTLAVGNAKARSRSLNR